MKYYYSLCIYICYVCRCWWTTKRECDVAHILTYILLSHGHFHGRSDGEKAKRCVMNV